MLENGNFFDPIAARIAADPASICLETDDGDRFDRAWLDRQSARYANGLLALGCERGDRVAVQIDKSPQSLALYLACLRSGVCFLPINTAYRSAELAYFLADAKPRVFVCRPPDFDAAKAAGAAADIASVLTLDGAGSGTLDAAVAGCAETFTTVALRASEMATLIYTSGTTGRPKGAVISHAALDYCARTLAQLWAFRESDVLLHALPLFHAHGLFVSSNVALFAGAKMIFHRGFDAQAVTRALPSATVFMGVPTYYHRLLGEARFGAGDCRNLRLFTCGSAPLSADVLREFRERTGHTILERYGATETMIMCANPLEGERRAGSVGRPLPGVELRIADEIDAPLPDGEIGMIEVRSPGLFSGYWNLPEATAADFTADGYFRTGDLGQIGAGGYVSITGRSKDLIISGGYNVYPAELEAFIDEHPAVRETAVIGLPHADFGEAVVALVIAREPANPPDPDELIRLVKTRFANFKTPKRVLIVSDLPRNAMGKVQKNQLRKTFADLFA